MLKLNNNKKKKTEKKEKQKTVRSGRCLGLYDCEVYIDSLVLRIYIRISVNLSSERIKSKDRQISRKCTVEIDYRKMTDIFPK